MHDYVPFVYCEIWVNHIVHSSFPMVAFGFHQDIYFSPWNFEHNLLEAPHSE
jgi:hypothetical protein